MKVVKRFYLITVFVVLIFSAFPASAGDVFKILLVPLDNDENGLVSELIAKRISGYRLDEIKIELVEEWKGLRPEQEFGDALQPPELLERLSNANADLLITGTVFIKGDAHIATLWLWPRFVDQNSEFRFPTSPIQVPILLNRGAVAFNLPLHIYSAISHKFAQSSHPLIWGRSMYLAGTAWQSIDRCAPIGGSLRFQIALTADLDWPPQSECDTGNLYHARPRILAARRVLSSEKTPKDMLRVENRAAEISLFIGWREENWEVLRLSAEAMKELVGLAEALGRDWGYRFNSAVYDLAVGTKLRDSALLDRSVKQFGQLDCADSSTADLVCRIGQANAEIKLAIVENEKNDFLRGIQEYIELYNKLKMNTANDTIEFLADIGMARALMEGGTKFGLEELVADGLSIMKRVTVNFHHSESFSMHNRIMEIIDTYDGE